MQLTPHDWARITGIFDVVRELPPADREARLLGLTAGDAALQQEVESLLSADADDAFLAPAIERAFRPPPPNPLLGRVVGAYRIEREIGRGGMGVVCEIRAQQSAHADCEEAARRARLDACRAARSDCRAPSLTITLRF